MKRCTATFICLLRTGGAKPMIERRANGTTANLCVPAYPNKEPIEGKKL